MHVSELLVIAREVEHGVRDGDISEGVGKRHFFDVLDLEVSSRQRRDRLRVLVDAKNLVASFKK